MDDSDDRVDADGAGAGPFRTLAQLGRQIVRQAVLDDPELAQSLEKAGALNPEIAHDSKAEPVLAPKPKKALASLLNSFAATRGTALGSAGVGGLEALAAMLDSDDTAEGEPVRNDICIVFTDIEDFTKFTERSGDEAALALLARHAEIVEPAVFAHGGTVVKRLGDGFMLRFSNAVHGVEALLDVFDRLATAREGDDDHDFEIRAGMTVGRPIVVGDDLVGSDVNLAARVTAAAKGGELLATQSVVDAIDGRVDDVDVRRARTRRLKGFKGRTPLFELRRAGAARA